MPSTTGTGSKTAIPNQRKMAGSQCYSIVTRSDVSFTRSVSFFSECNLLTRALHRVDGHLRLPICEEPGN